MIAGEGSFAIQPQNGSQSFSCRFSLVQRADDVELLRSIGDSVGCGRLHAAAARGTSKPPPFAPTGRLT
jgi:LAGLIDADG endonuclease